MAKILLTVVLPLVLPTAVYVAYMLLVARRRASADESGAPPPLWGTAPWPLLVGAGVGLMMATLFTLAFVGGGDPGTVYTPAHVGEDGRVIPGTQAPPAPR